MRLIIALVICLNRVRSSDPLAGTGADSSGSQTKPPSGSSDDSSEGSTVSIPAGGSTGPIIPESTNVYPPPERRTHPGITSHSVDKDESQAGRETTNTEPVVGAHKESSIAIGIPDVVKIENKDGENSTGDSAPAIDKLEDDKTTSEDEDDTYDSVAASKGAAAQLLSHLFGEAIDSFAGDATHRAQQTMTIDCNSKDEDNDSSVNIVTTLCPLLRSDGACGQLRHPSYEVENNDMFCSEQCRPQIDVIMKAFQNRANLSHKHEVIIFRDVAHSVLEQYCSLCRPGCVSPRFN